MGRNKLPQKEPYKGMGAGSKLWTMATKETSIVYKH